MRASPSSPAVGVVNVAPSVVSSFNSAVRIYFYDAENSNDLLDYAQFYIDLDAANANGGSPNMAPEYMFLSTYLYKNMSLASWVDLENRIATDPSTKALHTKLKYVSSGFNPKLHATSDYVHQLLEESSHM